MLTPTQAAMYRRMTIGDEALMTVLLSGAEGTFEALGHRTASLVRLAALIVADAETPAYQREVRNAINAGASPEQITEVLLAIARVAGTSRVMSAAPKLALALGYDVDAGLEDADARESDA
jgi:alkylhydroperoxidase/carboxymuconolactone decarboxylase family protein YurZ